MGLATPDKISSLQRKLYTKSKQEPEFRFYSLIDKVCRKDVLRHAYRVVRGKDKAPGVDGVTFEQIEEEGRKEKLLEEIRQELIEEEYQASPVKASEIHKRGGGTRPLGIPTVKDRIVQAAVKIVIEPIFEADMEENAYGFRPERSAWEAIERAHKQVYEADRKQVVDADLKSYFDTIPHDQLLQSVARRIADGSILALINQWLKAPIQEEDEETGNTQVTGGGANKEGTPQGGVISPLLANIYINRLLKTWKQREKSDQLDADLVDFADDFVTLTRGKAEEAREWIKKVIEAMGLKLNEEKTKLRDLEAGEELNFLGYTIGEEIYPPTGKEYIAVKPSRKSIDRFKEQIDLFLQLGSGQSWEDRMKQLRRKRIGWLNYFRYGSTAKMTAELDHYLYEKLYKYLSRLGLKLKGVQVGEAASWLVKNLLNPRKIVKNLNKDPVWDLL